jgi:ATP-dependent DNA helicase DinG
MPSPFDYANKAVLHVPKMQFDPSKADLHTEEIADWLNRELPTLTSVLVLFTSWRQMRRVEELIDTKLLSRLTVQGELSKQAMLVEHKARIDRDEPSVIFGLASFAEGVDLPGHYLKDVIITKLPFSVPDDPVDATLAEWIEARGGNPFMEISVPAASIKLTQAAGRLLRTENDSGRVVLLDRRVVTRRYGQQLIDALPPFARHFE